MIYRLRKKFIRIVSLSFTAVFLVLLLSIYIFTATRTNASLDELADIIYLNNGRFPLVDDIKPGSDQPFRPGEFDIEAPFTTRFFSVRFDIAGELLFADIRSIASVTEDEAVKYAEDVLNRNSKHGWMGDFRYKKYENGEGTDIIFVNGFQTRSSNRDFLMTAAFVFMAGSVVVLVLVILLSKKAIRSSAESYEKQKRFITDAGHELKTPLTLIRTNLDIIEAESGLDEWMTDIRYEADIMTELVNRLVALARMDEDQNELTVARFNMSEAVSETVSMFVLPAKRQNKELSVNVPDGIFLNGDEGAVRQLVSVLMDNAVKYCDPHGTICVSLQGGRRTTLTVDNTYEAVGDTELSHLFDRFYRADKARTSGSGFGIGLSIAKAIAEKHHGSISVYGVGENTIRFQVKL